MSDSALERHHQHIGQEWVFGTDPSERAVEISPQFLEAPASHPAGQAVADVQTIATVVARPAGAVPLLLIRFCDGSEEPVQDLCTRRTTDSLLTHEPVSDPDTIHFNICTALTLAHRRLQRSAVLDSDERHGAVYPDEEVQP